MEKERCLKGCLKGNKNKCHSKPRPLPLGRAPEGLYPGSDDNDLESHRFLKRQQGEILKSVQDDVFFYNNGFTLIELLVVVLIIGILAAVALPQYQKVVEKSKATQALTMLKTVGQAMQSHYLASGEWATSFDELALDIPWTGNVSFFYGSGYRQGISNGEWSLQFRKTSYNGNDIVSLSMGRISGTYAGAGFIMYLEEEYNLPENEILCQEIKGSITSFPFSKSDGDYCIKMMRGTLKSTSPGRESYYTLP